MNVTFLRQTGMKNCGQTAMAMLIGTSIKEVEALYGHGTTTYQSEHIGHLKSLGYDI